MEGAQHSKMRAPAPSSRRLVCVFDHAREVLVTQLRQILGAVVTAQGLERAAHTFQPPIHRMQVIEQLTNGARYRVRHVLTHAIGIETELLGNSLALGFLLIVSFDDDPPRDANRRSARRHLLGHHGIRADLGARADRERPQHLGTSSDHHTIFQRRMALTLVPTGAAKGYTLVKSDVIADLGGFTDDDAHTVVDKETPANLRTRVNFDTRRPAPEVRHHSRQPLPATAPQRMRQAMQPHRMQPRIASDHLKGITRRRIAMKYALDILSHALKHLPSPA